MHRPRPPGTDSSTGRPGKRKPGTRRTQNRHYPGPCHREPPTTNDNRNRYAKAPEATSLQPGSQHGDLGELVRRAVAVLGQPADVSQASQRPPCVDEVAVDVGAVAGDDLVKVLLVSERESGEVKERVALGRLGPVDHAGDLVTGDEDVVDLQVAVREDRCPRPERSLGEPAVARDQVGGKEAVGARA